VIECLATDAELVAEGVERAIPGLITAAMTAIQAVRQGIKNGSLIYQLG